MSKKEIAVFAPPNIGWLEYKLNKKEMDYVWKCIENKKENCNTHLAGNITSSYDLMDRGDWFWSHVVLPLADVYADEFVNLGNSQATGSNRHPYYMKKWWVNYQKKHEFNPIHNHDGLYSYVIWMKIPKGASYKKQNAGYKTNCPMKAGFQMQYTNIMGQSKGFAYQLEPEDEGRMIFFPAKLDHLVYPFYNCDEDRISVSGNVTMDTSKRV